jgi:hypothetical protein
MVKKSVLFVILFVFSIFLLSNISAQIQLSSLKPLYNLGDNLEFTITLGDHTEDYLDVTLICDGNEQNIYHNVPDTKTSTITRKLVGGYIGELSGDCFLFAKYGEDSGKSSNFKISDKIIVDFETDKEEYNASEIISLKGKALKENGLVPDSAFIEASFNGVFASDIIKNGEFSLKLSTLQTMHGGTYPLIVKVYDKDEKRNIMNSGEIAQNKRIVQEPGRIEIAINNQNIAPSENLSYIVNLYDFAGDKMDEEVLISVKDSMNNSVYSESLIANQNLILTLIKSFAPGKAVITVQKDGINGHKEFYVSESKKISSEVRNSTLIVSNEGNVDYNEEISIVIGNETIKNLVSLGVGESKILELSAPEGNYEVDVQDSSGKVYSGNVFLTGKVIDAKEIRQNLNLFFRYPLVWLFILFIVFFAIILTYKNSPSHTSYSYPAEVNIKKPGKIILSSKIIRMQPRSEELNLGSGKIKKAEQVLVTTGHKQESVIVYFKIKNKLSKEAGGNLVKILESASKFNGIPYKDGYSYGIIFSPIVTKSFQNEKAAVNAAIAIDSQLKDANRKFKDKIEYGIGINSGEVVTKVEGVTLQFTNMGKTVPTAKKIAEISNQEVLISEQVHRKTEEVKVEKASPDKSEIIYFKINRVIDSEYHKKFIEGFLRRNN